MLGSGVEVLVDQFLQVRDEHFVQRQHLGVFYALDIAVERARSMSPW
jgi:hypothetical protein